jgi:Tfp pilus assembly protein PilF
MKLRALFLLGAMLLAAAATGHAQTSNAPILPASNETPTVLPAKEAVTPDTALIQHAVRAMQARNFDEAMKLLHDATSVNAKNQVPYFLRASILASRNDWPSAEKELLVAEAISVNDVDIEMFLGDVFFMEKKYDEARKRFAGLTHDKNRGDIALFKAYLCDILAGRNALAAKEIPIFDQHQERPSYFYAHAATDLAAQNRAEATGWLHTAAKTFGGPVIAPYLQPLSICGLMPAVPK